MRTGHAGSWWDDDAQSIRGQNHRALLWEIVDHGSGLECVPVPTSDPAIPKFDESPKLWACRSCQSRMEDATVQPAACIRPQRTALLGVFRGKNVSPGRPDVTDSMERISAGALIKSVGWKDLEFAVGCRDWSVSAPRPVVSRTSIALVDRVLPGNTR
ncbi:MAG: hypothetical protein LQ348_002582 [Seirophora lacunosa]|nr:MAG: hypothetical protein LQ348_002582 [Seirophora lacunosa]